MATTHQRKSLHFSFAFERNRLLAVGQNRYELRGEVLRLANKFGIHKMQKIPSLHAEFDLILRLWGNYYVDGRIKVVVLRLNKKLELLESKPCPQCWELLTALGVNKIWYSSQGKIIRG